MTVVMMFFCSFVPFPPQLPLFTSVTVSFGINALVRHGKRTIVFGGGIFQPKFLQVAAKVIVRTYLGSLCIYLFSLCTRCVDGSIRAVAMEKQQPAEPSWWVVRTKVFLRGPTADKDAVAVWWFIFLARSVTINFQLTKTSVRFSVFYECCLCVTVIYSKECNRSRNNMFLFIFWGMTSEVHIEFWGLT